MPGAIKAKQGPDYLADYEIKDLERMLKMLPDEKPRMMIHVAILRKEGHTCGYIEKILKKSKSTIHDWLVRLVDGGLCRIYDTPSPGRPCKLDDDEWCRLELTICNGPRSVGYNRDTWTAKVLAEYVEMATGKKYSASGIRKLASRMGYSWRVPRPVPYNSATPEEQKKFKEEAECEMDEHCRAGYKICCYDVCAKKDSPTAQRGIRTRGGTDTVSINYSKKSIQILGVLGDNTLDIMFSRTYTSEDTIRLIDHIYNKYGKFYLLLDNAGANKSHKVQNHVKDMNGDVVLKYTLPHTPQLNPIEPQWLVLKGAVDGTYFGDFRSMQATIQQALERGEIPVVRLQEYMLGPTPTDDMPHVQVICID